MKPEQTQTKDQSTASQTDKVPVVKVTCIRKMAGKEVKPTTTDGGVSWALPFNPPNGLEVSIFPGRTQEVTELRTGLTMQIPTGYEAHVRHVFSTGRKNQFRPALVLTGDCGGREIIVPVVNTGGETIYLQPGDTCAIFTLVKQAPFTVE